MRALLIGIGKAGCRIVNTLTAHELKSAVKSVRSFAFDEDRAFLKTLTAIDSERRIQLTPSITVDGSEPKGYDFELSGFSGYINDSAADEADAIFVCAGLGGKMAEALPVILPQLNEAFADPVFTILTLPARSEGARISARAAAELEAIREVANASIIFDNETWIIRLEEERAAKIASDSAATGGDGVVLRSSAKLSINEARNDLNELLTRRVELLLRAGEVTPKGIETAEVVLDAGEVLNTLKNTDIVSIGYSAERIPRNLLGFFNRFRMEQYLLEEGHKRTARIVNLAKRAVYEEVSVPCDLTTADKALILITGPSDELSMKGFHSIRKWIDTSIKGLEMRAGDYPVRSTHDVAVIIVLAGIENVPRIAELNDIRESYEQEVAKKYASKEDLFAEKKQTDIRPATDTEIFEEGEVFSMSAQALTPAAPATAAALPPAPAAPVAPAAPAQRYAAPAPAMPVPPAPKPADDDMFFEAGESAEPAPSQPAPEDDVFEEIPVTVPPRPATPFAAAAAARTARAETPVPVPAPEKPPERKRDPQISLAGTKRAPKAGFDSVIPMPKRNKQPDMVLSGQADLGKKKVLKDGMDRTSVGLGTRPIETEDSTSVSARKTPKETDSHVSAGTRMRPKETDGTVSAGIKMQPKDTDGAVSTGAKFRPKETDNMISSGRRQMPKEDTGSVTAGVRMTPNDSDKGVSVGTRQTPKEIGKNVSVGPAQKPNDSMGDIAVGARQTPNEGGNNIKVAAKRPATTDVWRSIREAKKPRDADEAETTRDMKWV